jgi:hypothetical protein
MNITSTMPEHSLASTTLSSRGAERQLTPRESGCDLCGCPGLMISTLCPIIAPKTVQIWRMIDAVEGWSDASVPLTRTMSTSLQDSQMWPETRMEFPKVFAQINKKRDLVDVTPDQSILVETTLHLPHSTLEPL